MEMSPLLAEKCGAGLGSEGQLPTPLAEWAVLELLQARLGVYQPSQAWHHLGGRCVAQHLLQGTFHLRFLRSAVQGWTPPLLGPYLSTYM